MAEENYRIGIDIKSVNQWGMGDECALYKKTRVNFAKFSPSHAKKVMEVIYSDLCGLVKTSKFSDKRYIVTFIDDKLRFCVAYLT